MFTQVIVRLLGGIWHVRTRSISSKNIILKKIYTFLYFYTLQLKGSWISPGTRFNDVPLFPHGIFGVFISGGSVIGQNCVIFQQVTIGSNTLIDSHGIGSPHIGNNCYIGAGAKIIGNIKIGDNVRIGANAIVYKDVPDNSIVISGTQKIIQKEIQLDNRFFHKHNGEWAFYQNGIWNKVESSEETSLLDNRFS